jgi:uncharacterized protein YciI
MQFLVFGYDGKDEKALERRMANREAHMAGVVKMKEQGNAIYGIAMLDEQEKMIGSVMVMDFPSRADVDAWLKVEPYVTGKVWAKVEVFLAKVPPLFLSK